MNPDQPPIVARPTSNPRQWIRLAAVECRHVEATLAMIRAAAEALPPGGRAIVLGPGDCRELPLAWLAARFGALTLVDRRPEGARQAVDALPPGSHGAIQLRGDDLIGVNDEFLGEVERRLAASRDADHAAELLVQLAQATEPRAYVDPQGPHDLVLASCVLSQVANALTQGAVSRYAHRFPQQAAWFSGWQPWTEALFALSERAESAFMDSLAGLAQPEGRAFLSETMQACFVHLHPQGGWQTEGTYRMTRRPRLTDYLADRWVVEKQGTWPWVAMAPAADRAGRLFQVEGLVLRPA